MTRSMTRGKPQNPAANRLMVLAVIVLCALLCAVLAGILASFLSGNAWVVVCSGAGTFVTVILLGIKVYKFLQGHDD